MSDPGFSPSFERLRKNGRVPHPQVKRQACQHTIMTRPLPNPTSAAWWSQYAVDLYATPRAWAHKSENLVHAFQAIAAASIPDSLHLNLDDQALMLAGMSVEVQLKAILVSKLSIRQVVSAPKRPKSPDDLKIWCIFYSHNLSELAELAEINLDHQQQQTASALSQYIYWRGRYVVPTERGLDDLIPLELDSGLVGQAHQIATIPAANDLINCVIKEVKERLYGQL